MSDDLPKNFFELVGEAQARKVHERRVATIKQEKEQDDQRTQFSLYQKSKRAEITAMLTNPLIGDHFKALMKFLKTLGLEDGDTLVDYVINSQWLVKTDEKTRDKVLSIIGTAIMRIRVQHGLPPFDDPLCPPLGDDPPNAYMLIEQYLKGMQ